MQINISLSFSWFIWGKYSTILTYLIILFFTSFYLSVGAQCNFTKNNSNYVPDTLIIAMKKTIKYVCFC
jgi:hypothetical protein